MNEFRKNVGKMTGNPRHLAEQTEILLSIKFARRRLPLYRKSAKILGIKYRGNVKNHRIH